MDLIETRRSQLLISFTENLTSEINTEIKIFDFQEWGRQKKYIIEIKEILSEKRENINKNKETSI